MDAIVRRILRKPWCEGVTGLPATSNSLNWRGRKLKWVERAIWNSGLALLNEQGSGKPVLALNIFADAFIADPGYIGIYTNTDTNGRHSHFSVSVLALNRLAAMDIPRLRRHGSGPHFFAACDPVEHFEFNDGLAAGIHRLPRSRYLRSIPEALIVAYGPSNETGNDRPSQSIYSWRPSKGILEVLPQRWFTNRQYDKGISVVARHPKTARLWVSGGQSPDCELDESGTQLEKAAPNTRYSGRASRAAEH
jgi:hypothetical protein